MVWGKFLISSKKQRVTPPHPLPGVPSFAARVVAAKAALDQKAAAATSATEGTCAAAQQFALGATDVATEATWAAYQQFGFGATDAATEIANEAMEETLMGQQDDRSHRRQAQAEELAAVVRMYVELSASTG